MSGLLVFPALETNSARNSDNVGEKKRLGRQCLQCREPLAKRLAVVLQLVFHDLRAVANLTEMCVDTHQPTDSDEECDVIYNVQGGALRAATKVLAAPGKVPDIEVE